MSRWSLTVVAETGERFSGFAPYVASLNDAGLIAFQAALHGGGSGVFVDDGDTVTAVAAPPAVAEVTSHPDVDVEGTTSFYGRLRDGTQGVFLARDGNLRALADTSRAFASIGPLGPTMSDAGVVAFRGEASPGVAGVFVGDGVAVRTVADTNAGWTAFHGLPVVDRSGAVVFRAERGDGRHGIHSATGGSTRAVAETGETFATLGLFPSVANDGTVAFAATLASGQAGVFTAGRGEAPRAVTLDGAFESYRGALISGGGAVILVATPHGGGLGLFAGIDPEDGRILAVGDPLLGSVVADLAANPVSVDTSGRLAVRATLADGRDVVLRADPAEGAFTLRA